MHAELEYGPAIGSGRQVRYLMKHPVSTKTRIGLGSTLLVLVFVVYAQNNLDDVVAFVQWVTSNVVEGKLGITKEMLEG